MAVLVSPGTSISVIDQSMNVGAGPGTVPLVFIVTQENKLDSSGTAIAAGTLKANAGKVWSITSQRDLVSTFGTPVFAQVSGSSINGYPLNEYGLLATYSYLGISNLARVVRADIDTAQLEATPVEPTSPAAVGTYWLDESGSTTGSSYGLFKRTGPSGNEVWTSCTVKYVYNYATGTSNAPSSSDGIVGDFAVMFQTVNGNLSYWTKTNSGWTMIGSSGYDVIISTVWPDLSSVTQPFWIKASSAAQGANLVIRRMDATTSSFVQVEAPILANDAAANTYYSTTSTGSAGQLYIQPVVYSTGTSTNSFEIKRYVTQNSQWALLGTVVGSKSVPTQGPAVGQLWFNSLIGLDSNGQSTIDILVCDGQDHWQNINLPGYTSIPVAAGQPTLYVQSADPRDNQITPTLIKGDIWVDTDQSNYPVIYRWSGSAWLLVDNTDQTTPNGIIFKDARSNPEYHSTTYSGKYNAGEIIQT